MARLNEPPVSMDTLETLRKKMLRQNRDLAKSNSLRALRIRELENECASMLSENLELRGRILGLEKQAEDNESGRIADHALAIKSKLESQLTEWGTLLAGLGLEPPMKKHSPNHRRTSKPRLSFSSHRPSPSQRRLRDISREIEELGHISEHKSTSRRSMNPQQILALRNEADSADSADSSYSPELGPPPVSQFIESEPVKVDSPSRPPAVTQLDSSPLRPTNPPINLPSPTPKKQIEMPPSPEKKREPVIQKQDTKPKMAPLPDNALAQPIKTGSKRKHSGRDEVETARLNRITDENKPPRSMADKTSIREKAGGKTLKELASMRKEARERPTASSNPRKILAPKSTNNDPSSPQKVTKSTIIDEVAAAKADFLKAKIEEPKPADRKPAEPKTSQDRAKPKPKNPPTIKIENVSTPFPSIETAETAVTTCELDTPLVGAVGATLLSPSSPEPASDDGPRGDTPPPADITSNGETTRPSRRSKSAISYAEPNLRDKMRRPSKQLFDAVAGEGKYARRSSQCEPLSADTIRVKRESDVGESWKDLPTTDNNSDHGPHGAPASPLAGKGSPGEDLPSSVATGRRRRASTATAQLRNTTAESFRSYLEDSIGDDDDTNGDDGDDPYEFTSSSPRTDTQESKEGRRKTSRPGKPSRRFSAALENDDAESKERGSSRRRSMML